jgi:Fe-S cluster assembly scaffold protein SufB
MTFSQFFSYSGPLATFIAAAVVILAAFRTNTARVWKEEAEAQKARADRLAEDLTEIKNRLTRIERENARLIQLLTALDPNRLAAVRLATHPTED